MKSDPSNLTGGLTAKKEKKEKRAQREREGNRERWFYNVLEVKKKKKKVYLYPQKNKMLSGEMAEKED